VSVEHGRMNYSTALGATTLTQSHDRVHRPSIKNGLVAIQTVGRIFEHAKILRGRKWSPPQGETKCDQVAR